MKALRNLSLAVLSVLATVFLLQACANPSTSVISDHQLLSVTITPATGTASGSTGQVQFVATGHYNTEPFTVTPLQANWGVESYPQSIATTDQNGLATCKQGSSGTTIIEAWVMVPPNPPAMCNVIDSAGRPGCFNVGGSAQLTCP